MIEQIKKKIVVSSIPLKGHLIPVLKLANALAQRGYEVTFMTSKFQADQIQPQSPNLAVIGFVDGLVAISPDSQPRTILKATSEKWMSQMRKQLLRIQPQIIVCDFGTPAPMNLSKELKIKLAVNVACQSTLIVDGMGLPTINSSTTFLGLTFLTYSLSSLILPLVLKDFSSALQIIAGNLVLVNSFPGFEEARTLPPNFKFVGPLTDTAPEKKIDAYVEEWIEKMRARKKDIVYVTFGSIIELTPEFISNFYQGIKKTKYAYLWSLKKGQLPEANQNVMVKRWLPQEQLIRLPEVKAVVSHGGWGGIMECLAAGKPILGAPFGADQPKNIETIVKKRIGLALFKPPLSLTFGKPVIPKDLFEPELLGQKLDELINNPIYKQNMARMQQLAQDAGGIDRACNQIQKAIAHGYDHLIDRDFERIKKSKSFIGTLVGISTLIGLGYLLNKYGFPEKIKEAASAVASSFTSTANEAATVRPTP